MTSYSSPSASLRLSSKVDFLSSKTDSSSCSAVSGDESKEKSAIEWEEYFKGNYKLMTGEERNETINRLTRSYELRTGKKIKRPTKTGAIRTKPTIPCDPVLEKTVLAECISLLIKLRCGAKRMNVGAGVIRTVDKHFKIGRASCRERV